MIFFTALMSSLAIADRLGAVVSLGPPQLGLTYHRLVTEQVDVGLQLSGSRFTINHCGIVYRDPNSTAGTFECNLMSIWSAQIDVEALYHYALPLFWDIESTIAIGSYLGVGVYTDGAYERLGLLLEYRIDQEKSGYGIRAILGHHGLIQSAFGLGLFATVSF